MKEGAHAGIDAWLIITGFIAGHTRLNQRAFNWISSYSHLIHIKGVTNVNRREWIKTCMQVSFLGIFMGALSKKVFAADAKPITDKDILKDGQPATIANYCSTPDKQPNKACPAWKEKPGHCSDCNFFNKDASLTSFKGGKYARCMLLTEPGKPQFVSEKGWCATYVKKA